MHKPYFYAKKQDGQVKTNGVEACLLGHKVIHAPNTKADGIFAEWKWDGRTLTVENDRYGFYPVYYYCTGDEICISPSIIRLLEEGAPAELDYTALSVFLRIGFYIGEDTPFKHIRVLPPNTVFQWANGELKVSGEYCCARTKSTLPYKAAQDKYIDLFRQAMKRRLPPDRKFAVPITGGRDARHILFELDVLGSRPAFCLTIQKYPPLVNDIRVGRLIAERLNLKHVALDYPGSFFKNEMRRNIETNFCSDELRESAAVTDYLLGKTNIYFDGMVGDVLSTHICCHPSKVELFEQGRFDDLVKKVLGDQRKTCFSSQILEKMFLPDFSKKVNEDRAVNHLKQELKKHAHAPNPSTQFHLWNRTRREIALSAYAISSEIPTLYSPFLDHDLYDFLSSLDARTYFLGHDFHSETIARAYPQYADIPYEDSSNKTHPGSIQKKYARDLIFYLLKEHRTVREYMHFEYIIPRLINHSINEGNPWICPSLIQYMTQLGKAIGSKGCGKNKKLFREGSGDGKPDIGKAKRLFTRLSNAASVRVPKSV